MKIVVFTPISNKSAIAVTAELINQSLREMGFEIVVVSTEVTEPGLEEKVGQNLFNLHWLNTSLVREELASADRVLHHIGDNWQAHAGSVIWLPQSNGVAVMHDFYLGNLMWSYGHNGGSDIIHRYLQDWQSKSWEWFQRRNPYEELEELWRESTFSEWLIWNADGVVIHSEFAKDRIEMALGVAPHQLHLPRPGTVGSPPGKKQSQELDFLSIAAVGNVNPNRHLSSFIEALSKSPMLRNKVRIKVAGAISEQARNELEKVSDELGVNVEIVGRVSDSDLVDIIDNAELIYAFRHPALESASASVIDCMLRGKTCLVNNEGFYRELPENSVVKFNFEDGFSKVIDCLEDFKSDRRSIDKIGQNARNFAIATYRADVYAIALDDFYKEINNVRPQMEAGRQLSKILEEWGVPRGSQNLHQVVEKVSSL